MDRGISKIFLSFLSHKSIASLAFLVFLFSSRAEFIEAFSIFEKVSASSWTNNYYSDVVAATSPDGTTGYVQRFQNGSIYWNDRTQKAYPVYGEIEREYEIAGGSGGDWGFPTSDPYTKNGAMCQQFEIGEICPNKKKKPSTEKETCEAIRSGEESYKGEASYIAYCRPDGLKLPTKYGQVIEIEEAFEYRLPNDPEQPIKYKVDCDYDSVEEREKCIMSAPDFDKVTTGPQDHNAIDYINPLGFGFPVYAAIDGNIINFDFWEKDPSMAYVSQNVVIHGKRYTLYYTHIDYNQAQTTTESNLNLKQGDIISSLYASLADVWRNDTMQSGYCRLDNKSSDSRKGTFGYSNNEKPRCYPSHLDFVVRDLNGSSYDPYGICTLENGDTDRLRINISNNQRCKAYNYPGNKYDDDFLAPFNGPSFTASMWEGDQDGNIFYSDQK